MARLTENSVLFAKGDNRQIFVDKVALDGTQLPDPAPKGTKKKIVLVDTTVYSTDRKVYELKDVYAPDMSTVAGCEQFLTGFNNLPCQPRSGYDSFVNDSGATNPKSPKKFSAHGTFRIALCYIEALYMKVAQGGQVGEDAAALLAVLPEYSKVAMEGAKKTLALQKTEIITKKAEELGLDADEQAALAEFMAQRKAAKAAANGSIPAAAVSKADVEDEADMTADDGMEEVEVEADEEIEQTA